MAVAPLYGEGRGLKPGSRSTDDCGNRVAPLYGEGRGLKPKGRRFRVRRKVAPLYGEGRGLKQDASPLPSLSRVVAPLYGEGRGLKRRRVMDSTLAGRGRSSLWRGAWIETGWSP